MNPLVNLGMNAARRVRDVRRWRLMSVPVRDCVNFNAFPYRREGFHPLHCYLFDLEAHGTMAARQEFTEFFRFYRPLDAAQALGLDPLDKPYPLFLLPWDRFLASDYRELLTWRPLPIDCSDIFTRYSQVGLASYLIEDEWFSTERALDSLRNYGYRPNERSYLQTRALVRKTGERRYLLLDGNHRAAAMCYLGWENADVVCDTLREVRESDADKWWGVRKGYYTRESALAIFHAYFNGNTRVQTTATPAPINAPAQWSEIYLGQGTPETIYPALQLA